MVNQIIGLAILGGAGWLLLGRRQSLGAFGETGIPWAPTLDAFDRYGGVPYSPDEIERRDNATLDNGMLDLELGWLTEGWGTGSDGNGDDGSDSAANDWFSDDWSIFDMTDPRGLRNNNPGNIEYDGTPWRGLDNPPSDGRFARFTDPVYGLRAMARTLGTYADKHGIDSVGGIVNRWAPEHGRFDGSSYSNNTGAYAAHVADHLGVRATDKIDVKARRPELIEAMTYFENGEQPYPKSLIEQGVSLA